MNNIINRVWNRGTMVNIEDLRGSLYQNEQLGHTFVISGVDGDGNVVSLSGTVDGAFLRPDNTTVAISGSASGGKAYVTLPANCYDVPGKCGLTIYLTADSQKTALYAAVVTVTRTSSDTASPGTTASVVDLVNAINAAISQIPATDTAIKAAMAPTYSNTGLYAVGSYAWYNGVLKRCIVPITTAESYTAAHWTDAALGNDLRDLKNALRGTQVGLASYEDTFYPLLERGNFQRQVYSPVTNTTSTDRANRISARNAMKFPYDIILHIKSGFKFYDYKYSNSSWAIGSWHTGDYSIEKNTIFMGQIARSTEVEETADIDEFLGAITVEGCPLQTLAQNVEKDFNAHNTDIVSILNDGIMYLDDHRFVVGKYKPQNGTIDMEYSSRISTTKPMRFPYDVEIVIADGYKMAPTKYENGTATGQGFKTGHWTLPATAGVDWYFQITTDPEDTSVPADIATYSKAVTIQGTNIQNMYGNINTLDIVNIEQGQWTYTSKTDKNTRLRTNRIIEVSQGDSILFSIGSLQATFAFMTTNPASSWTTTKLSGTGKFTAPANGYVVINISKAVNTDTITPSDYSGIIIAQGGLNNILTNINEVEYNSRMPEITDGKNVYIYQFADFPDNGNGWCFVRTPSNYKHKDKSDPCKLVICNHGNGWVMDGSLIKANYTNITMYWNENKQGWDSSRMINTSDESLWGSNPTIEALLAAGYVVCGCENYKDAQYGNNPCRNACVQFFYHMISNYNVEPRCCMIGASNGALTSLNAAYLLQGSVKAMVLQYPLTCLVNQYFAHDQHQAGIDSAYGIPHTSGQTRPDTPENRALIAKYVATHDPLTVDTVDGKKVGVFPPTKLYYSEADDVVPYAANAVALYNMLDGSNKVTEKVKCENGHGDASMFDPSGFLAWFEAN